MGWRSLLRPTIASPNVLTPVSPRTKFLDASAESCQAARPSEPKAPGPRRLNFAATFASGPPSIFATLMRPAQQVLSGLGHGCARVSTGEQTLESQLRALRAAGCATVAEERASVGDPAGPVLAALLDRLNAGDTQVVVRLDRLGRFLLHLLETISALQEGGVHFRSLGDPVDTASPQGRFTLQILGAMAEFERALVRERTMSGLAAARAEGRRGGNPGLVSGDRAMLYQLRLARCDAFL